MAIRVDRKSLLRGPARPRQPVDFMREHAAELRRIEPDAELDFSFAKDAVEIIDMRIPSAQRRGVLYRRSEVADGVDKIEGDFEKRVHAFMGAR